MSAQVFTGAVCQSTNTLASSVPLPSQWNFIASNCVALLPISGSMARPRLNMPIVAPSFGATLNRKFAARSEPAPGMFCTTTVGWPGMCLPMWRARMRA